MRIGESILRYISRNPDSIDYHQNRKYETPGDELLLLREEFPDFSSLVNGKRILDFGCGNGRQAIALAKEESCYVCGVDTNSRLLEIAKETALHYSFQKGEVYFLESPKKSMHGAFDLVISQNAMEHYPDPVSTLKDMKYLIHKDGKILITFGPPWYAPYGSHMNYFCKVPWLNIIFSENTVMKVRSLYKNDGANKYEEVESGLNKMTINKFEEIIYNEGLKIEFVKYRCVKGQDWLAKIPLIRELFINHVSCILSPNINM